MFYPLRLKAPHNLFQHNDRNRQIAVLLPFVLFGTVERVGGAEPRVTLRLHSGESIHCEVSGDLAKQLGRTLYERVVLEGTAVWDAYTGERKSFQAVRLGAYGGGHAGEALRELGDILRHRE